MKNKTILLLILMFSIFSMNTLLEFDVLYRDLFTRLLEHQRLSVRRSVPLGAVGFRYAHDFSCGISFGIDRITAITFESLCRLHCARLGNLVKERLPTGKRCYFLAFCRCGSGKLFQPIHCLVGGMVLFHLLGRILDARLFLRLSF